MGRCGLEPVLVKRLAVLGFIMASCLVTGSPAPAVADGRSCDSTGEVIGDFVAVGIECNDDPSLNSDAVPVDAGGDPYLEYQWVSACLRGGPRAAASGLDCGQAQVCPDPLERLWWLWGRPADDSWTPLYSQCFGRPPTVADTPQPTVTPGLVLNALRRIGLPALQAKTQPTEKTLVNFDTIFYAEPQPFRRTLTLLGQRVDVEATPTLYTWHHGDGTTATTTAPGAPYPAMDITHQYTHAHTTVQARVDVTYTARFRVNNGAWHDITETVTTTGPTNALRISEATAVLSGDYE